MAIATPRASGMRAAQPVVDVLTPSPPAALTVYRVDAAVVIEVRGDVDLCTAHDTDRAYLGVHVGSTSSGGTLVTEVETDGPTARAGITPGDIITAINGTPTPDPSTLAEVVADLKPGQTVKVAVTAPDGTTRTAQVTPGQYPG